MTNFLGVSANFLADIFKSFGGLKITSPIKVITNPGVEMIEAVTGNSGLIMLVLAFIILFFALRYLTRVLKNLILGKVESLFDEYIFKTAIRGFIAGIVVTVLVQSSSITTSIAVPLLGAGILTLEQILPYTMGANIGTTLTAMLGLSRNRRFGGCDGCIRPFYV